MSDQCDRPAGAVPNYLWKIIVVGDRDVGRSSLIIRYAERTFYNYPGRATIGADFKSCLLAIDEVIHKLQIWDTVAGERWGPGYVSVSYYRGTQAVILVYDITNRDSYESLVEKWIMAFRIQTAKWPNHKVLPVIVGTKLDLNGQRQVFLEEAEAYARSIGAVFYETSARTGENVDKLFEQLSE